MSEAKKHLAEAAANLVESGSIVGLGTGTTASFFIESLAKRCEKSLAIKAIASSNASEALAKKLNIDLIDIDKIDHIDIYIDGADEVDQKKQMIKGRGAALLKEKILAKFSKKTIIMIEEKKRVNKLGKVLLPVEVVAFASNLTKLELEKLGYHSDYRRDEKGNFLLTDNKNYILDLKLSHLLDDPDLAHKNIISIPGVIETGLFIDLADTVIVANEKAELEFIS
ncbi:MAG: Ribose-5-phosphate isomerase A [Candidatus Anoxychlamydiales bacterium]|nr:Ribose-5-phosphate isomerase A [Candidatus Anoxychlamydiales bacterium]HEU64202.1 ribose-5-phosphate isomerase RpiA [Chlamydiota bacterium]